MVLGAFAARPQLLQLLPGACVGSRPGLDGNSLQPGWRWKACRAPCACGKSAEAAEFVTHFKRATTVHPPTDSHLAALAAVRAAHQAMQAREQRRAQLAALLQAEGLCLEDYQYSIAGMRTFIEEGTGSPQVLVARAVAASQAANPPPGLQAYAV